MSQVIHQDIEQFVREVVRVFDPQLVILFGSHAREEASPDSDVDLLVIMDFEDRPQLQALNIRKRIKREFPLDLIVRRPSEIEYRLAAGDFFFKDIVKNGKVLYERTGC